MPKIKQIAISKDEFLFLIEEAGLTKESFLSLIDCRENVYYAWTKNNQIPLYVKVILDLAIEFNKIKRNGSEKLELIKKNRELKRKIALKKGIEINYKKENNKVSRKEIDALVNQCNFKSYYDLCDFLHIHIQTISFWNRTQKYPKYLKQLLEWLVYIKEFENKQQLKSSANNSILLSNMAKEKYQTLQINNAKLKQKLEDCILMERMLKEKLKSR